MKMKELSELGMDELLTKRRDLRQESLHLRLQQQSGQLEQPSRLRLLRRDLARIRNRAIAAREKTSGEIDYGRARISVITSVSARSRRLVPRARRAQARWFPAV